MLALVGEATDEDTLKLARIERASALATVLPDDAANGALKGKSVGEVERRGSGAFFVVQIDRPPARCAPARTRPRCAAARTRRRSRSRIRART